LFKNFDKGASQQFVNVLDSTQAFVIQDAVHITTYKPQNITSTLKYVHIEYEINMLKWNKFAIKIMLQDM
jgi:hypothetical protein